MNAGQAPPAPRNRPAGIVTRLLAAAIDLVVVLLMMGGLFVGAAGLRFLVSPTSFSWPSPSVFFSTLVGALLAIGYLGLGWATTGRTYGDAVLGLRVLSAGRRPLGWARSGLRAALCVLFPVGLLWAAVSRHRRSVQDIVVRSVVLYDWHRDGGAGVTAHSATSSGHGGPGTPAAPPAMELLRQPRMGMSDGDDAERGEQDPE